MEHYHGTKYFVGFKRLYHFIRKCRALTKKDLKMLVYPVYAGIYVKLQDEFTPDNLKFFKSTCATLVGFEQGMAKKFLDVFQTYKNALKYDLEIHQSSYEELRKQLKKTHQDVIVEIIEQYFDFKFHAVKSSDSDSSSSDSDDEKEETPSESGK